MPDHLCEKEVPQLSEVRPGDDGFAARTLLDTLSDAVYGLDAAGTLRYANPAGCRLAEYSQAELPGMAAAQLLAPEHISEACQPPASNLPAKRFPADLVARSGRRVPVWLSLTDPPPGCEGISVLWIARTRSLDAQDASAAMVLRLGKVGTWRLDLRARRLTGSPQMYVNLGLSPDHGPCDIPTLVERVCPEERDRIRSAWNRCLTTGELLHEELRISLPDGTIRHIATVAEPVRDQENHIVEVAGISQDITERKIAEKESQEHQQRYRQLFECAGEGILLLDGLQLVDCNPALGRMFRATREQILARDLTGLSGPTQPDGRESAEKAKELLANALAGQTISFYWQHRRFDGTDLDVEVTLTRIERNGGDLVLGLVHDVTGRLRAEESLRESERKFRNIVEALPMGMLMYRLGPDGRLALAATNPAADQILGIRGRDLIGRTPEEAFPGLAGTEVPGRLHSIAVQGGSWFAEALHYQSGARTDDYEVHAFQIAPGSAGVMFFDIGDRLRASEDRMRLATAIEQAAEDIVITDVNGRIEYCNPSAERVTGYTRQEMIGQSPRILKSGAHDVEFYRNLWSTITAGQVWTGQLTNRRKDGKLVYEDATISPILDAQKKILGFVAVKRDVTERLDLEARFRQAQRMEAVGQLAGGIAHDFNNLLTVINGYSDLLLKSLDNLDPVRASVAEIRNAGRRASTLTQQLLAFSRRQVLEPKVLNVNTVLRETESMLRRLIGENIELVTKLGSSGLIKVDPGQLQQVILNLVVNARDAMPDGGKLVLETDEVAFDDDCIEQHPEVKPGCYVMLGVTDTGIGMSAEVKNRLFEPFFTTKPQGKGTGLGLPTTFGIVKQSGGFIWVYSEPGQGTTFKVYFPLTEEAAAEPRRKPASRPAGGTETILVVEDQDDVRRLACHVLTSYGYRVLTAGTGAEALSLSDSCAEPIHLMLTDVVMPGMTGRELADRMSAVRPDMKVLFMSGYTDTAIVHQGILDANLAYLQKPFAPDLLASKVRALLNGPRGTPAVLIADDEAAIRHLLRQILEEAGYQVLEAGNGKEALAVIANTPVDVFLTDLVMPEQEGIETIRDLRSTHPDLKIIAMSGASGGSYLSLANLLGVQATLNKPLNTELLLKTLRKLTTR